MIDKDFYNSASAAKLGWEPNWFGASLEEFDEDLVAAIKEWQREHSLEDDGLVGPMTYRRVWTAREAKISSFLPTACVKDCENNYIVHNGRSLPIDWPKVVLWDQKNGLTTAKGNYTSYAGKPDRAPTMFVNHWDVCLSSRSCASVLKRRGISIHFCIDNDGTIYQLLDTQHKAWHASGRMWNAKSIGVEISNAYYPKYQDTYVSKGFGERPILKEVECHGQTLPEFTGFYPVQLSALKALWKAVHLGCGIPLKIPTKGRKRALDTGVNERCVKGTFEGFLNHFNLTRGKIDCAGLDLAGLTKEVRKML